MPYTPTTWNTGDTITASALNKIEQGIANAGGGDLYDNYDYVVTQADGTTPTLVKGSFSDIYDKLQDMEVVRGLYVQNFTPGVYHDTASVYVPITWTNYYSSADLIQAYAYCFINGTTKTLQLEIDSQNAVTKYLH